MKYLLDFCLDFLILIAFLFIFMFMKSCGVERKRTNDWVWMDYNKHSRHAVCFLIKTTSQDNLSDSFSKLTKKTRKNCLKWKAIFLLRHLKIYDEIKNIMKFCQQLSTHSSPADAIWMQTMKHKIVIIHTKRVNKCTYERKCGRNIG